MFEPMRGDIKYQKMSPEEFRLNYDRDMALYEQTEALKRIERQNNPYSYSTSTTKEYRDYIKNAKTEEELNIGKLKYEINMLSNKSLGIAGLINLIIAISVSISIFLFLTGRDELRRIINYIVIGNLIINPVLIMYYKAINNKIKSCSEDLVRLENKIDR